MSRMEISLTTTLRASFAAAGLLACASSFVHPFGVVKGQQSSGQLLTGAEIDPAVTRVIERSCQNCHSERTDWPWYSYVAPLSWLIEKDVHGGRSHMNLSHWDTYTVDHQVDLLTKLGVAVRNRRMPLPKYVQLHSEARLSDDELKQLDRWAHSERRRLRIAVDSKSGPID
jgi:hypothetical protein